MLTVLVALGSAVAYGSSDFLAGLAARRGPVLRATIVTYAVAVVLLGLVVAAGSGVWSAASVGVGAVAGLVAVVGFITFYAALAAGPMGVLSPLIAILGAAVGAGAGMAFGERLGMLGWAGVGAALLASALLGSVVAGSPDEAPTGAGSALPRLSTRAVVLTLVAGVTLGLSTVVLDRAPVDSGLAPAWLELVVGLVVLLTLAVLARRWWPALALVRLVEGPDAVSSPAAGRGPAVRVAVGAGALLAVAQGLLMSALHGGRLVVVAVLVGLYPLATVLLARVVLAERLTRRALLGVAAAVAAGVLLAWA